MEDWWSDICEVRKPQYLEGNFTMLLCPPENTNEIEPRPYAYLYKKSKFFFNTVSAHTAV